MSDDRAYQLPCLTYKLRPSGNMAAFDMSNPASVVSPGGVGFDINCGVRLLRTNLSYKDIQPIQVSGPAQRETACHTEDCPQLLSVAGLTCLT